MNAPSVLRRAFRRAVLRGGLLPCALLALVLWGGEWALRAWWEPDEARFVYVAHEMADSGSWLVPMRNGVPYPDKPPLMMWLIRAGETLLPDPFGSRLPLWIGATLALWGAWGIAERFFGRRAGPVAALVLATSAQFSVNAGLGQIDMLLLGLQMAGLRALFRAEREGGRRAAYVAGAWWGFAVLAKGPVGVLVPAIAYWASRAAAGGGAPPGGWRRFAAGCALAFLPVLAWLAAARWLGGAPGSYLRNIVFSQSVSRAAGAFGHRHGLLYFLGVLPVGFLPWTLALSFAIHILRPGGEDGREALRRLAAWAFAVALFFTIPTSKRSVYVLLAYPPAAIAVAGAWRGIFRPRVGRALLAAACAVLFLVNTVAKPLFNDVKTPVGLRETADAFVPADGRLLLYRIYGETLALHAARQGLRVDSDEEAAEAMLSHPAGLLLLPERLADDLDTRFPALSGCPRGTIRVGHKRIIWVAYSVQPVCDRRLPP